MFGTNRIDFPRANGRTGSVSFAFKATTHGVKEVCSGDCTSYSVWCCFASNVFAFCCCIRCWMPSLTFKFIFFFSFRFVFSLKEYKKKKKKKKALIQLQRQWKCLEQIGLISLARMEEQEVLVLLSKQQHTVWRKFAVVIALLTACGVVLRAMFSLFVVAFAVECLLWYLNSFFFFSFRFVFSLKEYKKKKKKKKALIQLQRQWKCLEQIGLISLARMEEQEVLVLLSKQQHTVWRKFAVVIALLTACGVVLRAMFSLFVVAFAVECLLWHLNSFFFFSFRFVFSLKEYKKKKKKKKALIQLQRQWKCLEQIGLISLARMEEQEVLVLLSKQQHTVWRKFAVVIALLTACGVVLRAMFLLFVVAFAVECLLWGLFLVFVYFFDAMIGKEFERRWERVFVC